MIGETISHYKILKKLGEGGMGVVYKAHDTKLDRFVALKFLPHRLSATEEEQARLIQEAKTASKINHPNVCIIYDLKEHDDQQFIVMEYVDGVTLREKFKDGLLDLKEAVNYAIQIGEALQAAHEKEVVHRDVKSENVMITSKNQVKVMDFGLAKLKGSLKLTKTSSTVGTLAYMSPEQINSEKADTHSDIFSFGVVLFETLTGKLPFRGEYESAMMYSILNEEPRSIQEFRHDVPEKFSDVINKALEKDPELRYQSAKDMVADLRRLKRDTSKVLRKAVVEMPQVEVKEEPAISHVMPPKKRIFLYAGSLFIIAAIFIVICLYFLRGKGETIDTIAILPLVNESNDPEIEYLCDGIPEQLIYRLSQLPMLKVRSLSSVLRYKGESPD